MEAFNKKKFAGRSRRIEEFDLEVRSGIEPL